jgi:hypothetical protein
VFWLSAVLATLDFLVMTLIEKNKGENLTADKRGWEKSSRWLLALGYWLCVCLFSGMACMELFVRAGQTQKTCSKKT